MSWTAWVAASRTSVPVDVAESAADPAAAAAPPAAAPRSGACTSVDAPAPGRLGSVRALCVPPPDELPELEAPDPLPPLPPDPPLGGVRSWLATAEIGSVLPASGACALTEGAPPGAAGACGA